MFRNNKNFSFKKTLKNIQPMIDELLHISLKDLKKFAKMKKLLKSYNFKFSVITYPLLTALYFYFSNYLDTYKLNEGQVKWYTGIAFAVFAILLFLTVYEIVDKRLFHKIQGDKLKMKQGQDWRSLKK